MTALREKSLRMARQFECRYSLGCIDIQVKFDYFPLAGKRGAELRFTGMNERYAFFEQRIQKHFEQRRHLQLRCVLPHGLTKNKALDFTSTDFLSLSRSDFVKKQMIKAVLQWGAGSMPSRVIQDHIAFQKTIEKKMALRCGAQDTLLFSSTFQAHGAILSALSSKQTLFFIDSLCSSKLVQAAKSSGAKLIRYHHLSVNDLSDALEKYAHLPAHQKIILTESLFECDGSLSPLREISEIALSKNALLYVDDSLSVGTMGHLGFGLCSHRPSVDIAVGSIGKLGGCFGAYVLTSPILKEYLTTFSPLIVASPPLPPAVLGAIDASLTLIPDMNQERTHINALSKLLRDELSPHIPETSLSTTHIHSFLFDSENSAKEVLTRLEENGMYVYKLPDYPRLTLQICAFHTREDILRFTELFIKIAPEHLAGASSLAHAYIP